MREGTLIRLGGELIKMQKVSHRFFRKINPRKKNGKWLVYWDGQHYYRFLRENNLPKLKKQILMFSEDKISFAASSFVRSFGFWGIYIYNSILLFEDKDIPKVLKNYRDFLKIYVTEKRISETPDFTIKFRTEGIGDKRKDIVEAKGADFLLYWLTLVYQGKVKVFGCVANDCERFFIPAKNFQKYCSDQCRCRIFETGKREREKALKLI